MFLLDADGDPVVLWRNKVVSRNNPQETYKYYYLPYCRPRVGTS